jgi:2-amino-4-hydroxy-6-hydroxymethyldihydropteridine diphosphokinase
LSVPDKNHSHQVYIGLGSNIDPALNFKLALEKLRGQVQIEAISKIWETPPVGTSGPNFLNAVAKIQTPLEINLLRNQVLRQIESQLGRARTADPNSPRPIDLDILIFEKRVIDKEIWNRAHIAVPLAEFVPDLYNPETGETLLEVAERLERINHLKIRSEVTL